LTIEKSRDDLEINNLVDCKNYK